jgi:hypothetical protein
MIKKSTQSLPPPPGAFPEAEPTAIITARVPSSVRDALVKAVKAANGPRSKGQAGKLTLSHLVEQVLTHYVDLHELRERSKR